MEKQTSAMTPEERWAAIIGFFISNKLVVFVATGILVLGGLIFAPFRWDLGALPRDPVPVDALPDISENQQIVFTDWPGRSPRDVAREHQVPRLAGIAFHVAVVPAMLKP